jgi:hypothetical protein
LFERLGQAGDRDLLLAGQVVGLDLQRQDAHADEVRAVDALERVGDDRPDAEEVRALGRPVARRARAVLLAAQHDERDAASRYCADAS